MWQRKRNYTRVSMVIHTSFRTDEVVKMIQSESMNHVGYVETARIREITVTEVTKKMPNVHSLRAGEWQEI